MPGPSPIYRPDFPDDFVEQALEIVRHRTVAYQLRQRATLVLLLHADPLLSNVRAAAEVHLHPNAVRYWRRRWAHGVRFGRCAWARPEGPVSPLWTAPLLKPLRVRRSTTPACP